MKSSNGFMAKAYRLSQTTGNPPRAYAAMRRVMTQTIKLLKARYVLDLFERLVNRGLALRSVTANTNRACKGMSEEKHRRMCNTLMGWKLDSARTVLKTQRQENTRVWRECEEILRENRVDQRFFVIWENEKVERRKELENKKERKVRHIFEREKNIKRKTVSGDSGWVVRGIDCSDRQLDESYESRARVYGGAAISVNEAKVLELTPKFSIYDEIDVEDAECELEKCLTKLRWERMDSPSSVNSNVDNRGGIHEVSRSSNGVNVRDSDYDLDRTVDCRPSPTNPNSGSTDRSSDEVSRSSNGVTVSDFDYDCDRTVDYRPSPTNHDSGSNDGSSANTVAGVATSPDHSSHFTTRNFSVATSGTPSPSTSSPTSSDTSGLVGNVSSDDHTSVNATSNPASFIPSDGTIQSSPQHSATDGGTGTGTAKNVNAGCTSSKRQWPYDPVTSTIDLRYLRSTDLPFNRDVYMPDPLEEEEEVKMQNLKHELIGIVSQYAHEAKASNTKRASKSQSSSKYPNLTKKEAAGLEKLKKRKDIVCFQTDKSGRFSVDTKESYVEATMPHVIGDEIVEEAVHLRAQKDANAHSTLWVRMMSAGHFTGTNRGRGMLRVRDSMTVENHGHAPLYSLRKDHKDFDDPVRGPPTRPVCGGSAAFNHKLSHYLGLILRPVWQEAETVCQSTEEMLAAIKKLNESGELDADCTIGSADVKALYPSIDVNLAAEKVAEVFLESGVEVDESSIDKRELGLYLSLNRTPMQLEALGIHQYCPKRKHKRGRPPNITGCAQDEDTTKRYKPWNDPEQVPDKEATKKMLAEALSVAVKFTMGNHMYRFNGEVRRQREGGPIGLGLTGDVAQILMVWWDRELIKRLEARGMKVLLYLRYVDDINIVVKNVSRSTGSESLRPRDEANMLIVQEVANGIHPSIQVTIDYPSGHSDLKMPILDLKVWPSHELDGVTRETSVMIMHEHYHKEVASRAVVNARSALPQKVKRTVHTQEIIRILRNCNKHLPWAVVQRHVEEYVTKLQFSGYSRQFRPDVVASAMKAFDTMVAKDQNGEELLCRPKGWKRASGHSQKKQEGGLV